MRSTLVRAPLHLHPTLKYPQSKKKTLKYPIIFSTANNMWLCNIPYCIMLEEEEEEEESR
jgi:hypothetical protein